MSNAIKVLVVDDSPLVRRVLTDSLERFDDIEVIAEASDGLQAIAMAKDLQPDVITMDVMMPMMDGMEAIEGVMSEAPTPVVVVAASNPTDSLAIQALGLGATHVFPKPVGGFDAASASSLASTIRRAAMVDVSGWVPPRRQRPQSKASRRVSPAAKELLVGIVGSTGGPRQLQEILQTLPPDFAHTVLIVQHTATGFTEALANWLDGVATLPVKLAREGEFLLPGTVHVAPDEVHLTVDKARRVRLSPAARVDGHRPSGSVLLESLSQFGPGAVGVVLTGMGRDGARGLEALAAKGGHTLVEDPRTATVAGMPQAALQRVPDAYQAGSGAAIGQALVRLTRGEAL